MAQSQGRSRVVLSEIAPHDGWIEIFNHGPEPVDLKRWSLAGGSGAATVMLPDVIPIAPNGFVIVQAAALNLTRSGSSITLRDPAGTIVDMAAVAPVEAGRSLSRFPVKGGGWAIDTPLTAGQYNLPGLVQEPSPLPAPAPEQDAEPAMPAVQAPPATPKLWMIPLLAAITGLVFLLVPWRRRSTPAAAPGGEEIKP
jgi:hypothetical protein